MAATSPPASCTPGRLHYVPPNISAFEPSKPLASSAQNINTLLWIGGMFDTAGSVAYPFLLAQALDPNWSLLTATLSSSGHSWGTSSIARDADDVAKIVTYVKQQRPNGKVIIMGHSTGCQDCMEYVVGKGAEKRPQVNGVILQAPVSDREALEDQLPQTFKHEADQLALQMCREGREKDVMPYRLTKNVYGRLGITARRWVDVSSPGPNHDGADDYFSSDLSDERLKGTFGQMSPHSPLLIVYSGDDESVPKTVDKQKLVQKWADIVRAGGGAVDQSTGVVKGASHNYNGDPEEVVQDLITRIVSFVSRLDSGTGPRI